MQACAKGFQGEEDKFLLQIKPMRLTSTDDIPDHERTINDSVRVKHIKTRLLHRPLQISVIRVQVHYTTRAEKDQPQPSES